MTARKTSPPEMTAWTSESGASASAPTWRIQANERDAHAEGERPRAEEGDRAAQRVASLDGRGGARAAVLQHEAEVGEEGANERQEDADF